MFIDRVEITARAGNGGDGCVSFRREKYIPRGGPNGGNGGNGGSVILKARDKAPSLAGLRHRAMYKAEHGNHGSGTNKQGRGGKDCFIPVPVGTMAWDADTEEFLGELLEHGNKLIIALGGRGGDGNVKFASPTNRIPQQSQPGQPGQVRNVVLEFAVPSEVALIGLPNSGKSTFLQALTNARSEIAEYEFTTRDPYIGVCEATPYTRFSILDLPALCAGSSQGQGLGNWFLRHVHRAKILILVLDSAATQSFAEQIDILETELREADDSAQDKTLCIVVNEKQPLDAERKKQIKKLPYPHIIFSTARAADAKAAAEHIAGLLGLL